LAGKRVVIDERERRRPSFKRPPLRRRPLAAADWTGARGRESPERHAPESKAYVIRSLDFITVQPSLPARSIAGRGQSAL